MSKNKPDPDLAPAADEPEAIAGGSDAAPPTPGHADGRPILLVVDEMTAMTHAVAHTPAEAGRQESLAALAKLIRLAWKPTIYPAFYDQTHTAAGDSTR